MTINERRNLPIWKRIILGFFTILSFVIQVALIVIFIILMYDNYDSIFSNLAGLFYILSEILGLIFTIYIIHRPINTNYKLTWVTLILIFPIPFIVLYVINGTGRKSSSRKLRKLNKAYSHLDVLTNKDNIELNDIEEQLKNLLYNEGNFAIYDNTETKFFKDIKEKDEDMFKEFENAKKYILIESFIVSKGILVEKLINILKRKGEEGVKIYIIFDAVGSLKNKGDIIKKFTDIKNCQITSFNPLRLTFNLFINYRDHRKITVIDGIISYCGGDNLADEYTNDKKKFGHWRDNCMKYVGEASKTFMSLFLRMWYMSTKSYINDIDFPIYDYKETNEIVMPFGDGPSTNENIAYDVFKTLIVSSKKKLYISTPYFILDDEMIDLISYKARCGVDVILLMPGIPDKKIPYYMGRSNYKKILKSGCKVYEYSPGFNHAKNIIVDDKYAFIGTINMDYRSLFLHFECGAIVFRSKVIENMSLDFIDALTKSKEITLEDRKKMNKMQRFIAFVLNIFEPLF